MEATADRGQLPSNSPLVQYDLSVALRMWSGERGEKDKDDGPY